MRARCAALLCRACGNLTACVAERYLTLRTGCEKHGRKNPLPFPFSKRSHIGNLRQIRKQGKGRSSKRKENRRLSFLFAHRRGYGVVPAAGRGTFPPSADGESPAEVQRKTLRPERANPPAAVRAPRLSGAGKRAARQGRTRLRSSRAPVNPCREILRHKKGSGYAPEPFSMQFQRKLTVYCCLQRLNLIGILPLDAKLLAAHVAVGCQLLVDRLTQVKLLDDRRRT